MPEDTTPLAPAEPQTTGPQPTEPKPATPKPAPAETGVGASAIPAAEPAVPDTGYTADGVPTFDGVREKIETRYGNALGSTELAQETPEVRRAAQQFDARHKAAEEKLAEIRASMKNPD